MIEVQKIFFKLCQLHAYDLAYNFSINASQMTQEPISQEFFGLSDKILLFSYFSTF